MNRTMLIISTLVIIIAVIFGIFFMKNNQQTESIKSAQELLAYVDKIQSAALSKESVESTLGTKLNQDNLASNVYNAAADDNFPASTLILIPDTKLSDGSGRNPAKLSLVLSKNLRDLSIKKEDVESYYLNVKKIKPMQLEAAPGKRLLFFGANTSVGYIFADSDQSTLNSIEVSDMYEQKNDTSKDLNVRFVYEALDQGATFRVIADGVEVSRKYTNNPKSEGLDLDDFVPVTSGKHDFTIQYVENGAVGKISVDITKNTGYMVKYDKTSNKLTVSDYPFDQALFAE